MDRPLAASVEQKRLAYRGGLGLQKCCCMDLPLCIIQFVYVLRNVGVQYTAILSLVVSIILALRTLGAFVFREFDELFDAD